MRPRRRNRDLLRSPPILATGKLKPKSWFHKQLATDGFALTAEKSSMALGLLVDLFHKIIPMYVFVINQGQMMVMTLWMRMWMILLNAMTMLMMVVVEYAGGVLMARGGWSGATFVEHRLVRGRSSNHSLFVFLLSFSFFLLLFIEYCSVTHQSQKRVYGQQTAYISLKLFTSVEYF